MILVALSCCARRGWPYTYDHYQRPVGGAALGCATVIAVMLKL